MSRTTVMDADIGKAEVTVKIQRHTSDMHTLAEDVGQRIVTTLKQHPTGCFYFNPAATVSCPQPTEEFFRVLRKEQARWCRQAGNTFPRKIRRSSSKWVSGGEWISNKFTRYLDRSVCFTGVLFIDNQLVLPHNWPSRRDSDPKLNNTTLTCLKGRRPPSGTKIELGNGTRINGLGPDEFQRA